MVYDKYKVLIFSENPDKLVLFYRDILGFALLKKIDFPRDYGYNLQISHGFEIWISKHSKIHGKSKETERIILNIYVDSVSAVYDLVKNNAECIVLQAPCPISDFVPNSTRSVLTILDPEGNCLQFMGGK